MCLLKRPPNQLCKVHWDDHLMNLPVYSRYVSWGFKLQIENWHQGDVIDIVA